MLGLLSRGRIVALLLLVILSGTLLACDLGGLFGGAAVPDVVIERPPNDIQVALGETVPIHATATDSTGVTRVELLVDGNVQATETSPVSEGQPSFSVVLRWQPSVRGSFRVVVKAYNTAGGVGESQPITVTVVEGAPGPEPTQPGPEPTEQAAEPTPSAPQPTETSPPPPTATVPAPPPTNTPAPPPPTATTPSGPCLPTKVTDVNVGGHPKGVAAQGHRVYVALHDAPLVAVIDADTNAQLPSINTHAGSGPKYGNGVVWHDGRIYVANRDDDSVSSVSVSNPSNYKVIASAAGGQPFGITAAGQYVYVANFGNNTVGKIDTTTDTYVSSILNISEPTLLTSLGQDVFVPTNGAAKVVRLLSGGGRVEIGPAREGFFAAAVNANDRVFVTNRLFGDMTKINANTNSVQGPPAELPNKPYAIAINPPKNRVYVVAAEVDLLYVLDGASLEIVGSVPVGSQGAVEGGQGIAVLGNRIYVSNFQDETVTVLDDSACP